MRVLFFITKSEQGGAQTHVAQLTRWLIEHGHEVGVMSQTGGCLETESIKLGTQFFANDAIANTANPWKLWQASRRFLQVVNLFEPDIVTCHSTMAGLVGRLSLRGRTPTVFTAHGWGFTQGAPLLRRTLLPFFERQAARWSRRIICVSKNDLELAKTKQMAPNKKLALVYNGIETPKNRDRLNEPTTDRRGNFESEQQESSRLTEGATLSRSIVSPISKFVPRAVPSRSQSSSRGQSHQVHIFFVGRLAEPKNPFLLVEAFSRLPRELQTKAHVTIIGDGPDRERLESLIQSLHLNDLVELTGSLPREQVLTRLQTQADIFVLLSHWEGFPYSILEAMSTGVPVIASRVGGIPEALEHGGGILVENEREQIAQALTRLITDTQQRAKLGAQAHHIAEFQFSVKQMCEKTFAIYEQVLLQ